MKLNKISIINYKNIKACTLLFSPKINCFIGNNGVGKTNMLDAIYFLSFCKSAFHSKDAEIMNHQGEYFVVEGNYQTDLNEEEHIYCSMKKGCKKQFKRNKKGYGRLADHIGLIPLTFISPADNMLIDNGGEERRKFMDIVICQYDKLYLDKLTRYNKTLQQRNSLLKQGEATDLTLMELLEMQMAEYGTYIYEKRAEFIDRLIPVFQQIYKTISGEKESVSLRYISHAQRGELLDIIQKDRAKDLIMGYSLHGIHRDDLQMLLGDYPIKKEGSQGQNKSFVLALKLAQHNFLRSIYPNNTPLLLLDDIFDKLDSKRVEAIIKVLADKTFGQIFITDTNRDHLDMILQNDGIAYKLFEVDNGEFKEKV